MDINFPERAHNHNYGLDPIVRSLLDTDFYKFPMQRFIRAYYHTAIIEFSLINRAKGVRLAELISIEEMREQLNYARTLSIPATEIAFMRGQKFFGHQDFFPPEYISFLESYKLPDYELGVDKESGQFILRSAGRWEDHTMWEMVFLTITNELKTRAAHQQLSKFELIELYAKATTKLVDKLRKIADAKLEGLNLTDFGTRRRHSHLWQRFCIEAAKEILGDSFTGTSNVFFAKELNLEAKGTNAHELPMAVAAMTAQMFDDPDEIRQSQYRVLRQWEEMYPPALHVMLPDTFGTTQFLNGAPTFLNDWNGFRPDSKEPNAATIEIIEWCKARGVDPKQKLVLFSDGLTHDDIIELHRTWSGQVRVGFGWGTNLTNDFKECSPLHPGLYNSLSLVAKVTRAGFHLDNLRPAVKLSDNAAKRTGPTDEVDFYVSAFGQEGASNIPVVV